MKKKFKIPRIATKQVIQGNNQIPVTWKHQDGFDNIIGFCDIASGTDEYTEIQISLIGDNGVIYQHPRNKGQLQRKQRIERIKELMESGEIMLSPQFRLIKGIPEEPEIVKIYSVGLFPDLKPAKIKE